jgi:hypothetical protein
VIVASQIIDPPPAATGQDPDTGAWLALGSALLMCAGAVLTFGRVHLALTVEGREPRQHVSAVDARGPQDPTTDNVPMVSPDDREPGGRLFARDRAPDPENGAVAATAAEPGTPAQDVDSAEPPPRAARAGKARAKPKQE